MEGGRGGGGGGGCEKQTGGGADHNTKVEERIRIDGWLDGEDTGRLPRSARRLTL